MAEPGSTVRDVAWLDRFLAGASSSLVLVDERCAGLRADEVELPAAVAAGRRERVVVAAPDRAALRRMVVPGRVRTTALAVWVADGDAALVLRPRPEWPALTGLNARAAGGGWLTVLRFADPVQVRDVVAELGLQSVWPDRTGAGGLLSADHRLVSDKVPPDLAEVGPGRPEPDAAESPVTGRRPYVVRERELPGPLALGHFDERVLNPTGSDVPPTRPVVDLADLDLRDGPTEALVRTVRPCLGVRVDLAAHVSVPTLRAVAGLAMAGVPVVAAALPATARQALGDDVADALLADVDLDDALARAEHVLVLRRAAHRAFSTGAWRRGVGALAGVRVAAEPAVSVLLATKRPEQLEHAIRQVRRQRGVAARELVLAPHGFSPDPGMVRDLAGPDLPVTLVPQPDDVLFGDVLHAAATAAGGDVLLKMDDDDWYAPDLVADLLQARAWSAAELVGAPPSYYFLTAEHTTVRIGHPVELYTRFVAGGTMLVERGVLREVGGFRSVRRYVDAQLLAAVVAAGGAVYRTHGLGYVLRRNPTGHTWTADHDDLLSHERLVGRWDGFRPSRLLEPDPADLP